MEQNRACRMCLLRDSADQAPLYKIIQEYVASLNEDIRADAACYAQRLAECRQCSQLFSGTCRLCGCYVEARAAKRPMRCPALPPRW